MNGPPKFQVIDEPYNVFIRDTENQLNFCHLCESGFGLNSKSRRLAEKIVEFLNSLPPEETKLW